MGTLRFLLPSFVSNEDVMSIKGSLVIWIDVRGKDDRSFDNDSVEHVGSININVKVESLRNENRFHFHWSEFAAPCCWIGPETNISEDFVL